MVWIFFFKSPFFVRTVLNCPINLCIWVFFRYKNLFTIRAHLKRHSGKQTCTICGKVLAHKEGLETHKQIHNPEFRERFKCTVCGKGFSFSKRLRLSGFCQLSYFDLRNCCRLLPMIFRNTYTFTPERPAHTIAINATKYFDSAQRITCTGKKCIQNRNEFEKKYYSDEF